MTEELDAVVEVCIRADDLAISLRQRGHVDHYILMLLVKAVDKLREVGGEESTSEIIREIKQRIGWNSKAPEEPAK
jgi:predicted ArsR family transcriptional regulator